MRSFTHHTSPHADIVQDLDGRVWVSTVPPAPYVWVGYERIEVLRAKGYDPARGPFGAKSGRPSQSGYHFDYGRTGRSAYFDESHEYDPLATSTLMHEWLEKYFAEDKGYPGRSSG